MADCKDALLEAFRELDTDGSGVVAREVLGKHFESHGFSDEEVNQLFALGGWSGSEKLPYGELVEFLFSKRGNGGAGADMLPLKLGSVPMDAHVEVVLQVLLIAAASWATLGVEQGKVRVEHSPSTSDAHLGFSVEGAKRGSPEESAVFAASLMEKVSELTATASIELEVHRKEHAVSLLEAEGSRDCAALVRSVAAGCDSVGLYAISVNGPCVQAGTRFRTPAVASVTAPGALAAVPWQIRAGSAPGQFHLVGPETDLRALAAGHIGRLGPLRAMDIGAVECNVAAKANGQTKVALQAETMHENSLAEVSAQIAAVAEKRACVVVVAGPSSSGKTTFSSRLALHIQARGIDAQPLECDMYYKARADPTHPRDANGELNFEVPDALRLDRIRQDLAALTAGKPVELPRFCFKTGTVQEKTGRVLQLPEKVVLIIEGIFGLHPTFLSAFGDVALFKVLIGPWSGARLGNLHVMPERKLRLLRRIGRDVRSRGVDAARVMHKFTSVSVGEATNIFPYAGSADVIFDSALHYELPSLRAVIGKDVEGVASDDPAVQSRQRELANYLSWVEPWPMGSYTLLPTSIACEFLGNSIFE